MMQPRRIFLCLVALLLLLAALTPAQAFAPAPRASFVRPVRSLQVVPSSLQVADAVTLDPTQVLSDVLGGLLGSPAIILVPMVAAVAVAGLVAFFIVSYASPQVEDDED